MIAWTIAAARESQRFDRILVSTDDQEIAEIAVSYGADVPFFRREAVDDHSSSSAATLAALRQAEEYWAEQFHTVVQLMANCPLRSATDIVAAIERFEEEYTPVLSCFEFGWMNPWWAMTLDEYRRPEYLFKDAIDARSQDLPLLYCPSGAIWIALGETLKTVGTFKAPGHRYFPIDWISAVDIDDQGDLAFAEACFLLKHQELP